METCSTQTRGSSDDAFTCRLFREAEGNFYRKLDSFITRLVSRGTLSPHQQTLSLPSSCPFIEVIKRVFQMCDCPEPSVTTRTPSSLAQQMPRNYGEGDAEMHRHSDRVDQNCFLRRDGNSFCLSSPTFACFTRKKSRNGSIRL